MGAEEEAMPGWAVRLETKVDIVLTQHGSRLDDHEVRIRGQEARRFVSPGQLWGGIIAAIAGASGLVSLINWLIAL
jgi:hypothetical protein